MGEYVRGEQNDKAERERGSRLFRMGVFKCGNDGKINDLKKKIIRPRLGGGNMFQQIDLIEKKSVKPYFFFWNSNCNRGQHRNARLSHIWKLSTLFWFECHLSKEGLRLMTEVDKWAHQRHINDSCVKRSVTVTSSKIHLNLARGGVGGKGLLT